MGQAGTHVLLVEDDDDQRRCLSALIRLRGYSVRTVGDGREALDRLREPELPSLVLLDLRLPHMDGRELRREMLGDARLALVPVVLLSGESDLDRAAEALGAVGYLGKPPDLAKLFSLLAAHCKPSKE